MGKLLSGLVFTFIACRVQATKILNLQTDKDWDDLRIRYDLDPDNGLFQAPRRVDEELIHEYVKVGPEADFKLPIDFYCYPDDPRACLMFDKKGQIAGVQISFVKEEFKNVVSTGYDYSSNPNFVNTNFFNEPAYSLRAYFTDPEKLTTEGRKETKDTAEGLWVYLENKLYQVPTQLPSGDTFGGFNKQRCIPARGTLFFYNLNKEVTCDKLFPMFVMYDNNKLVGFGYTAIGTGGRKTRNWYEYPEMKTMTNNRPDCMDELEKKYGITSMHVYFVKNPNFIACMEF